MDLVLSLCAFVLSIVGIIGCVVPVVPGVLLSYAGLLCAGLASYSGMSTASLVLWLVLAAGVTLADYFLPAWMTRRFGGSRAGALGATAGVVAGLFFGPLGVLFGPFIGAVVGELLHRHDDVAKALLVGLGSFLSFLVGTGLKLAVAVGMFVHVAADTWPVLKAWVASLL